MRTGWILDCPAPDFGELASGVYNAGPGLADDTQNVTAEDSKMQILQEVSESSLEGYAQTLVSDGYHLVLSNQLCQNRFWDFEKEGKVIHLSFFQPTGELHIVEDTCSVSVKDFSYQTVGSGKSAFYQYGLYYDPENRDNTGNTINCGMLYILKLSDNSLVMVDGGHIYQCSNEAIDGLWEFMHQITGTPEDGSIRISAWYITHAHGDHVTGCAKLLNRYHEKIDLQRVMYNFPSYQVRSSGYDDFTTVMKRVIRKYYPDVLFLKLHTGQDFFLSNIRFEILYVHEDAVTYQTYAQAFQKGETVPFPLRDYNCSSTILRFYMDGKSILLLGDTNTETEKVVTSLTSEELWRSDAVQIAHHCFNYLNILYPWISAPLAMLPNSYFGGHTPENTPKLESVLTFVENGQIYYEGEGTNGFLVDQDHLTCFYSAPVVGTVYDGSGY